jgi:hypothetical protein
MIIPLTGTDVLQEPGDFIFGFKNRSIKISGIPVDEYTTKVKYYGIYAFHFIPNLIDAIISLALQVIKRTSLISIFFKFL